MKNSNKLVQLWWDIYAAEEENNKNYTYNILCQDDHVYFVGNMQTKFNQYIQKEQWVFVPHLMMTT